MNEFNSDDYLEQRQKKNKVTANFTQVKALLVVAVVGIFVYIAWYAYTAPDNVEESSLPVIQASAEVVKSKPENPGGLVVANRDKAIYEGMSNTPAKKVKVEKTVTPPEAPVSKQAVVETIEKALPETKETEVAATTATTDFIVSKKPDEIKPEPVVIADETTDLDKELDNIQPNPIAASPVTTASATTNVVTEPAAPAAAVEQPAAAVTESAPAPVSEGLKLPKTYTVRIAALKTEQATIEAWKSLKSTYNDVLGNLGSEVQVGTKDGKEIYYLHAGPISSKAQAEQICKSLQERGRRCRVY